MAGGDGAPPETRICTSLAARTCKELAARATTALSAGSDLVEFRVDSLLKPEARRVKKDLGPFVERAIFTLRRADEGGGFTGSEHDRLTLMEECAAAGPAFFDVELRTLDAKPELARAGLGRNIIVSWHGETGTPSRKRLLALAVAAAAYGGIPKIVPIARKAIDNLAVLSLYDRPGAKPIAFCMGRVGLFSRVMAMERGSPITYASMDGEWTAPGQLVLSQALAIRRSLEGAW